MGPRAAWLLLALACAEGCTVFVFDGSGFAGNAFSLMHIVPVLLGTNGTFFLDNSSNFYRCSEDGGWHDFFQMEDVLVPWNQEREDEEPDSPCRRMGAEAINKMVFEELHVSWDELDFIAIKKIWKYQPWVAEAIGKRLAKLQNAAKPTVSFHVRGGDKLIEDSNLGRMTTTMQMLVDKAVGTFPELAGRGGTCMIVGDDHALILEASKLAAERLGCKVFRGSNYYRKEGHLQDHFNQQSYEDKCTGTLQVLIDMELLAHTDYFVASYNSRSPRVVQYLRYILYDKDRSTGVDASIWGLDLFSNIHRYFHEAAQPAQPQRRLQRRLQ